MKDKNIIGLIIMATIMIAIMPSISYCEGIEVAEGVTLDGTIRERTEFDDKSFSEYGETIERSYLRTRLGLSVKRIEATEIYIQIQDSRNLGSNSSGLTNDDNLGVHQAYVKFNIPRWPSAWMQLGRFEVKYGRERVLGAVGWSNVGRTFDGLRFGYEDRIVGVDVFLLKIVERGFDYIPRAGDEYLYGIYSSWLDKHLNLFYLLEYDHQESAADSDEPSLSRWTLGGYYQRSMNSGLDVKLDFAYQAGAWHEINIDNISAYLLAAELGYRINKCKAKPRFGIGFDLASGDDGEDADELNTYNDLYYTGHAFRGYMDYFTTTPTEGLLDIFLRFSTEPARDWWLGADFHYFRTAKDYVSGYTAQGTETSKSLGQEIDFTCKHTIYKGLDCQTGLSFFFPSEDWKGEDAEIGSWYYFMLTAGL